MAVSDRPVRTLLDYAAWALSRAGGGASDARLTEELTSVGEAARRLQVRKSQGKIPSSHLTISLLVLCPVLDYTINPATFTSPSARPLHITFTSYPHVVTPPCFIFM